MLKILFIAFLVVSFFLFQTWMVDTAPGTQAPSNTTSTSTTSNSDSTVPEPQGSVPGDSSVPDGDSPVAKTNTGELVEVKTDVLDIVIDAKGGDIVSAKLLEFAQSLDSEQRFQLLQREPGNLYIAQSGLIGPDGIDSSGGRAEFSRQDQGRPAGGSVGPHAGPWPGPSSDPRSQSGTPRGDGSVLA